MTTLRVWPFWRGDTRPKPGVSFEITPGDAPGNGTTRLWDSEGNQVDVPAPDAQRWIDQGFRRAPIDPSQLMPRMRATLESFSFAMYNHINESIHSGTIDHAENGLAHTAREQFKELSRVYADTMVTLETLYRAS